MEFVIILCLLAAGVAVILPFIALVLAERASDAARSTKLQVNSLRREFTTHLDAHQVEAFAAAPAPAATPAEPIHSDPVDNIDSPPPNPAAEEPPIPSEPISAPNPDTVPAPAVPTPPSVPVSPTAPAAQGEHPKHQTFNRVIHHTPAESPRPSYTPDLEPTSTELGWERFLGVKVFVWLGAIALGLAGIYLVKFCYEHAVLTPPIRIIGGLLLGTIWHGLSQWRRKYNSYWSQGLAAAGIITWFATILAATNLYGLLSPTAGFFGLAAVSALAVVLSLQQGQLVAILGLIGGFLTPLLIHADTTSPLPLFSYLILLEGGLFALSRQRNWVLPAILSYLATIVWVFLWFAVNPSHLLTNPEETHLLGLVVLLSTGGLVGLGLWPNAQHSADQLQARIMVWIAMVIGTITSGILLGLGNFTTLDWAYLGLLSATCFVLEMRKPEYTGLAWIASLEMWSILMMQSMGAHYDRALWSNLVIFFGVLTSVGAYVCMLQSATPRRWSLLSVFAATSYACLAYAQLSTPAERYLWAFGIGAIGCAYMAGLIPIYQRRASSAEWVGTLNILGLASVVILAIACTIAWDNFAWIMSWSVLAMLTFAVQTQFPIKALKIAGLILLGFCTIWLIFAPLVYLDFYHLYQNLPLFSAAYLTAIIAGLLSAYWLKAQPQYAGSLVAIVPILGFTFLTLLVHQYFAADTTCLLWVTEWPQSSQAELFTFSGVWLAYGILLLVLGLFTQSLICRWESLLVMLLTTGKVFLIDLARLQDLMRVGSFLGLGISLLGLAYVYQQYVFADKKPEPQTTTNP